ncbi:MAG: transporter substrate-binding domain-containing protein [Magnetococcales bacterium]|nr:transporter substrate-binding domain-containing protein [Magnetococcales bacterium]
MKVFILFFIGLSLTFTSELLAEKKISVCSNNNFWAPYSFEEYGQSAGIHIEIVKHALKNLSYKFNMTPLPWKRCQYMTRVGDIDALVSFPYKKKRADFFYYPNDAESVKISKGRITTAESVIVTPIDSTYEWNGDDTTLPEPIRLPIGYASVDRLRAKNKHVATSLRFKHLFAQLARDKSGIVISQRLTAEKFVKSKEYSGKLKILAKPYKSRSYFMGISKKSKITHNEAQLIWDEIAKVRQDEEIIGKIKNKVLKQIKNCFKNKDNCGLNL